KTAFHRFERSFHRQQVRCKRCWCHHPGCFLSLSSPSVYPPGKVLTPPRSHRGAGLPGAIPAPHRLGNALEGHCALPHRSAPQGARWSAPAAPVRCLLPPPHPRRELCHSLRSCRYGGFATLLVPGAALRAALGFLATWVSACLCPSVAFPPSWEDLAMYCRRTPVSRSGLQASVLADSGRR